MLCTHNTTTSASLDYCHKLTNPYLHQFSSISGGNCIREGQKEPPICQFTRQIGQYQTVEWQDILLVSCQPQTLPLAHKMEECNTYKKMMKDQNKSNNDDQKKVTVDEDKLKKGMAAIFPSDNFNTDDLAEALAVAIAGVE